MYRRFEAATMIGNLLVSRHSNGSAEGNITRNGGNGDNNSSSNAVGNMSV